MRTPSDAHAKSSRSKARLSSVILSLSMLITGVLPTSAQETAATMGEIGERAAVRRYLEVDLKLTVAKLKQLASDLGITVTGTKAKIHDGIVEWAVGRRGDSAAISRGGGGAR